MRTHRNRRQQPVGFTLVELLMVIGIIGFLITVSGFVIGNMIGASKEAATLATIQKVHGVVMERIRGLDIALETQAEMRKRSKNFSVTLDSSAGFVVGGPIAFRKLQTRALIPTRLEDLPTSGRTVFLTGTGHANVAAYRGASDWSAAVESSELLFFSLTQGTAFGEASSAADLFRDSELKDTNGNGKMEIVDGWGNPLRFYGTPTRLLRPDGWNATTDELNPLNQSLITAAFPSLAGRELAVDPDDPGNGFLNTYVNAYFSAYGSTDVDAAVSSYEGNFHTHGTYHIPLIVSAGPDGVLGIEEPNTSLGRLAHPIGGVANEDIYDNLTNYQGSTD